MIRTVAAYMLTLVLLGSGAAEAREASGCLAGQVVDLETGRPIPGALVMAPRTGNIKQTDAAGCFRLDEMLGRKSTALAIGLGIGLKKTSSIDPAPKKIVAIADGYKAFGEEVPLISADAGGFNAVVERIALARLGSGQASGVAKLSAPDVKGLGEDFQLGLSPAVITGRDEKLTLKTVVDVPRSLPINYQVKAVLSNGERVTLNLQDAPEGSIQRTYEASIDVDEKQNVLEVMVGSVVASTTEKMGTLFMVSYGNEAMQYPSFLMPEGFADRCDAKLLSATAMAVIAPGASPDEQESWREAAARASDPLVTPESDDMQALLHNVPDGPAKQYFILSSRLWTGGDTGGALEESDRAVVAEDNRASELLVREWALARIATLSGPECAAAAKAITERAFRRLERYGPAMRALGNACLSAGYHGPAGECFRKAESALGDLDGSIARASGRFYHFSGPTYPAPGREAGEGLQQYARAQEEPSARSYLDAAQALQRGQLWELAATAAERSVELEPTADAYSLLGTIRDVMGQESSPIDAYSRAVRIDPRRAATHFQKGLSCWGHRRFEDALLSFQAACSLDEGNGDYRQAKTLCEAWLLAEKPGDLAASCLLRLFLSGGSVLPGTGSLSYRAAREMLSSTGHPAPKLIVAALSPDRAEIDAVLAAPVTSPFWASAIQAAAADGYLRCGDAGRALSTAKLVNTTDAAPDDVYDRALADGLREYRADLIAFVKSLAGLPSGVTR